jgi:hypothetical protein
MADKELRRGDVVEVRSASEILATLDSRGMLEGLPFMPEMVGLCGQRFVVERRAEKICDTLHASSRRLPDCVLLDDLRCDGSAHDGCQADCRLFWKSAWLRRVDSIDEPARKQDADEAMVLRTLADKNSRNADNLYTCQATEHIRASLPLSTGDPRPYIREFTSGNVGLAQLLHISARAFVQQLLRKLRLRPAGPVSLDRARSSPVASLNLRAGDRVRTRSVEAIAPTLTPLGTTQGIWFDDENVPYCGQTFRVHRRIERYINDNTGEMVELKTGCVTLEGSLCTAEHSLGRWFCPRAFYVQWQDGWVEPVDVGASQPD